MTDDKRLRQALRMWARAFLAANDRVAETMANGLARIDALWPYRATKTPTEPEGPVPPSSYYRGPRV